MVNWSKAGEHFQETIKNVTPKNVHCEDFLKIEPGIYKRK